MLMKDHIAAFTSHIEKAMKIGEQFSPHDKREIRNVLVTGLGGSGIGGTIVAQICDNELQVPFLVSKDYFVPGFVGLAWLDRRLLPINWRPFGSNSCVLNKPPYA